MTNGTDPAVKTRLPASVYIISNYRELEYDHVK